MKCFYKLPCDYLSDIQTETLNYLRTETNMLDSKTGSLWNKIHTVDYLKKCPSLMKFCSSLKLKIKEIAFTVVWPDEQVFLHIDELPVTAKINFPILNTSKTINQWYKVPDELLKKYPPIMNSFGKEYYSFNDIDLTSCELLAETELDQPIVFNSQIAHTVRIPENSLFPRVVMPVMFFNEPLSYLK